MVLSLLGFLGGARPTHAAEFSCAARDVACLIAAINAANLNGEENVITLAAGIYTLRTVDNGDDFTGGPNGLPVVTSALTIRGASAGMTVIERASNAPAFRLFRIAATGTFVLDGLTLSEGITPSIVAPVGGGVLNSGGGVTLRNCILSGHQAGGGLQGGGGGIANSGGTLTVTRCSVVGNSSTAKYGSAGGILNSQGVVTLTDSTVAGNSAEGTGAGLGNGPEGGTIELENTLLANTMALSSPDCSGEVTSLGANLIGDPSGCTISLLPNDRTGNPELSMFTDDGVPGHGYCPLLPTSQAIDAGHDAVCPPTDQLGQSRVGGCDIGAVEYQPEQVTIHRAMFVNSLAHILVSATSSADPHAELFVTVQSCLEDTPMQLLGDVYMLWYNVAACGNLDGQQATVKSSYGG